MSTNFFTTTALLTGLMAIATLLGLQYIFGAPPGLAPPPGSKARVLNSLFRALGQYRFHGWRRNDWVARNMPHYSRDANSMSPLRFNSGGNVITLIHGTESARSFFSNRDLNFRQGITALRANVAILSGNKAVGGSTADTKQCIERQLDDVNDCADSVSGVAPTDKLQYFQWHNKHLRACLSNKRLTEHNVMANIALDIYEGLQDIWKRDDADANGTGLIHPVDDLSTIILRISIRAVASVEMAKDKTVLRPLLKCIMTIEKLDSLITVMLAKLPWSWFGRKEAQNSWDLRRIIHPSVEERITSGRREQDYVQVMIDSGALMPNILFWLADNLFASVTNTASMFIWTLALTSADPQIWQKLRAEVDETLARLIIENDMPASVSVPERFARLTIEQLESNFQYTHRCIRECIRLLLDQFLYRRVLPRRVGGSTVAGGETVREGEFVVFLAGTIHHSADVYPDPLRYDPDRWERNEGSGPYEFVGWGAGIHPCIGMKLANNELKMAIAMVASTMDIVPVDDAGEKHYTAADLPRPKHFQSGYREPSGPLCLRYTMRDRTEARTII